MRISEISDQEIEFEVASGQHADSNGFICTHISSVRTFVEKCVAAELEACIGKIEAILEDDRYDHRTIWYCIKLIRALGPKE